jgi:1-acyl-sn-glycerol-3-phosphate acyltransferase
MLKRLCALIFRASGWTFRSELPPELRSFIFLGAPHTSNHDFIPAMAVAHFLGRNAKFVIKDDWLRFPMNLVLGPMGAVGIDRRRLQTEGRASTTDLMADLFRRHPELVLMIAPEGTRRPNPEWKTGFYYTAKKAGVPIVLGFADFATKVAGTGPVIYPTDFDRDMRAIMKFYETITPRRPENSRPDARFS